MGEIRIVGQGKTRGYPYLMCKKEVSSTAKIRTNSALLVRNPLNIYDIILTLFYLFIYCRVCEDMVRFKLRRSSVIYLVIVEQLSQEILLNDFYTIVTFRLFPQTQSAMKKYLCYV